jgi:hypothetical protein
MMWDWDTFCQLRVSNLLEEPQEEALGLLEAALKGFYVALCGSSRHCKSAITGFYGDEPRINTALIALANRSCADARDIGCIWVFISLGY